jgi:hypothetical protein
VPLPTDATRPDRVAALAKGAMRTSGGTVANGRGMSQVEIRVIGFGNDGPT